MSKWIENIQQAVEAMHKCKATHEKSVPVVEKSGDEIVWKGVVEVFALKGNRKAKRCYAWNYMDGDEHVYIGMLEAPPVDSPESAVRHAFASGAQK